MHPQYFPWFDHHFSRHCQVIEIHSLITIVQFQKQQQQQQNTSPMEGCFVLQPLSLQEIP